MSFTVSPAVNLDPPAWYRLEPLWQADMEGIERQALIAQLPPPWKLLLLSDGSVTRHLQVLTGESTEVDVIDMSAIGMAPDQAPPFLDLITGPRLRRQVWLRTAAGQRLAYAASWWDAAQVDDYLANRRLPMWASLAAQKAELYRELCQVVKGRCAALEEAFSCNSPLWGRYYFFWHAGKPLTLVYEVFSPALQQYLGYGENRYEE